LSLLSPGWQRGITGIRIEKTEIRSETIRLMERMSFSSFHFVLLSNRQKMEEKVPGIYNNAIYLFFRIPYGL
jgi:hypothetical protein